MISEVVAELKSRGSESIMDDDFADAIEEGMTVSRMPWDPSCHRAQDGWQIGEMQAAIEELETEHGVSHDKVAEWLKSWGTAKEKNAP
jgi:predicted transcriptional regulator